MRNYIICRPDFQLGNVGLKVKARCDAEYMCVVPVKAECTTWKRAFCNPFLSRLSESSSPAHGTHQQQ